MQRHPSSHALCTPGAFLAPSNMEIDKSIIENMELELDEKLLNGFSVLATRIQDVAWP
jgi:hypothetical protein